MKIRKYESNNKKLHPTVIQSADKMVLPSLSHQFDVPFFIWKMATIMFAITPQIPLLDNFPLARRKLTILFRNNKQMLMPTKFAMADLFTFLLRLTTAPSTCWSLFFTSTHNACNVMRGHNISLRHSVKHYEAVVMIINFMDRSFILIFNLQQEFFRCKEW